MTPCNNIFLLKLFVWNYFDQFYILHFISITIINFVTLILTGPLLITIPSSIDKVFTLYKHVCYYCLIALALAVLIADIFLMEILLSTYYYYYYCCCKRIMSSK